MHLQYIASAVRTMASQSRTELLNNHLGQVLGLNATSSLHLFQAECTPQYVSLESTGTSSERLNQESHVPRVKGSTAGMKK